MGAIYVSKTRDACSTDELQLWFKEETARQRYQKGNDAYAGVWESNLKILPQSFSTVEQAEDFIQKTSVKYGPVLAARVGDFSQVFPVSKADQTLVAQLEKVAKARLFFEFDVATRVRAQKSSKKTCSHCSSSINVQKLWIPTREQYRDAVSGSTAMGTPPAALTIRGKVEFLTYQGVTDCPVCGNNFMLTETDVQRKASLVAKEKELRTKVAAAKAAFDAKHSKQRPQWYLGSWCSY